MPSLRKQKLTSESSRDSPLRSKRQVIYLSSPKDKAKSNKKQLNPERHSIVIHQQEKNLDKKKPYRVFTTLTQYKNIYQKLNKNRKTEPMEEDQSKTRLKNKSQYFSPELHPIEIILEKHIKEKSNKNEKGYLIPTVNSILMKNGKTNKFYSKRQLCSVNCIDRKKNLEREIVFVPKNASLKKFVYSPTIREIVQRQTNPQIVINLPQNLTTRKDAVKCEKCGTEKTCSKCEQKTYFRKKYQNYQKEYNLSKKNQILHKTQIKFFNLKTQYAKEIEKSDDQTEKSEVIKKNIIPKIPQRQRLSEFIDSYSNKNENIDLRKLLDSPHFMIEYSAYELYFGQMLGTNKHGIGILIQEGKLFEGIFRSNQKISGVEINLSGVFKGDYYRGKREGQGQFQWFNGEYYIGHWKQGKRHGQGLWENTHGDSYKGEWKNGKGQGYGVYIVKGQKYKGQFIEFQKEGWGKETFLNGDEYEGSFVEGFPSGKGIYSWANGTVYEGEFKNGLRKGRGVLSIRKFVYVGEFVNEKAEGVCQISFPNGDMYKGSIKNGQKNGRGMLRLADEQKTLDGYWEDDMFVSSMIE